MKLNVGLFNDSFPPQIDGVANAVQNYAAIINNNFGKSLVVTPKYPGYIDKFPFEVYRYRSLPLDKKIGYRAGNPFSIKTIEYLRNRELDLIHLHCPFASALLSRLLTQKQDIPVILTYHTKFDIDIHTRVSGRIPRKLALELVVSNINTADEVWAVSDGAGKNLQSLGYKGAYRVMENGVDFEKGTAPAEICEKLKDSFDIPNGVPVFLFVGRMIWYKNLRLILDALKILDDKKIDFRMIFVGDGFDREDVEQTSWDLGLEEKVFFAGNVSDREDLRAFYSIADLFLFPSTYDTNGLVVREAAACDLAAVLIDGSCAAEGVTDGVDGFLIDENAGSMAAKLQEICKRPECMAQVGCQAGDRLYLSWGDAVKRARERYGIVMENYRMGRYDDHHRPMDGVLNAQGSMMDALAKLRDLGDGLAERYREGWDEHREGIQERRDEFREEFQERLEEHREGRRAFRTELKQKGEALWQKLDRYL